MPLVLRPRYYPAGGDGVAMSARMVMAADQLLGQEKALTLSHALLHALWSEEKDIRVADFATQEAVADGLGLDGAAIRALAASDKLLADWYIIDNGGCMLPQH